MRTRVTVDARAGFDKLVDDVQEHGVHVQQFPESCESREMSKPSHVHSAQHTLRGLYQKNTWNWFQLRPCRWMGLWIA